MNYPSFIPTYKIYNRAHDINGFMGYKTDEESIYISIRGSQSAVDWLMDDIRISQVEYEYCNDCQVHSGFYAAERAVIDDILVETKRLISEFPTYEKIVSTGHSLGAAIATLIAMDLISVVGQDVPVQLITFGSPRLFDVGGSEYVSSVIHDSYRVTHTQDVVPHLPTPMPIGYQHISTEWYEDIYGNISECEKLEEDPSCASQWNRSFELNADDHMWYLGNYMSCPTND
jgi:predicted lipase